MHDSDEVAVCRGCGRELNGKPCYMGGDAYHPDTRRICRNVENSFPGAGPCLLLSQAAEDGIRTNWRHT